MTALGLGCTGAGTDDEADRSGAEPSPASAESDGPLTGTVLVFAAASLSDAFDELAVAFEEANPGVEIQLNLGGSSALREQILDGAPADVFASANETTMAEVVAAGRVTGSGEVFVTNRMQIAVPPGNPGGVTGVADFADPDLVNGLCTPEVPCGDFARQILDRADVDASIDTYEPDVRALLAKIEADELDAGIVYATDVLAAGDRVAAIDIPADVNVTAGYAIARLVGGANPGAGQAFVDFVLSADGRAILAAWGFSTR
jgi:molybdate transport system substrate-binding protein